MKQKEKYVHLEKQIFGGLIEIPVNLLSTTRKFWYKFYWSTRELTRELYLTKLMVPGAGPTMDSKCI